MSRKKNKETHDLASFMEINEKMKEELDDDEESTKYEDSEASVPPYADYGIMNNDITQLPKEFMNNECGTKHASMVDASFQLPPRTAPEKVAPTLTKKNFGFLATRVR